MTEPSDTVGAPTPVPDAFACIHSRARCRLSSTPRQRRDEPSLTARWPWIVAFTFGLLHGFGFAGALIDIGLPQGDIPLALFSFNVGVELGQLIVPSAPSSPLSAAAKRLTLPRTVDRMCCQQPPM